MGLGDKELMRGDCRTIMAARVDSETGACLSEGT